LKCEDFLATLKENVIKMLRMQEAEFGWSLLSVEITQLAFNSLLLSVAN